MAEEKKKDFVVRDKRVFKDEMNENADDDVKQNDAGGEQKIPSEGEKKKESERPSGGDTHLPEINFPTFIVSLHSSALVQLGLLEDPSGGTQEKNLPLAKQTIDILGMLEEKTKGNLTDEESKLLTNILFELRMLFVKEKK